MLSLLLYNVFVCFFLRLACGLMRFYEWGVWRLLPKNVFAPGANLVLFLYEKTEELQEDIERLPIIVDDKKFRR